MDECKVDICPSISYSDSSATRSLTKSSRSNGKGPQIVLDNSSRYDGTASTASSKDSKEIELDVQMSQLGLYGRQKETNIIQTCLDDLIDTGKNKLLYISGLSGTGKTALAMTVAEEVTRKEGIFALGKFDQKLRDEPYAGIAAAGRHICGEILHRKNNPSEFSEHSQSFEDLRKAIIENVGAELATLTMILPDIDDIVGTSSDLLSLESGGGGDYGANRERLHYAIRAFFRTVAKHFKPLVMVLDDIQWADMPSIHLLEVLMTDDASSNFMLVGLYRSNEVNETHPVNKMIKTLDEKEQDFDFSTTKIHIGDLDVVQVNEILMNLLHLPSYRTSDLADIVHRRTGGNAFFVLNFIEMLKQDKMVVYSDAENCWVWDESEIELETIATDNVVGLLKERMKNLPRQMQEILKLAACLGASFREESLSKVVSDYLSSRDDAISPRQLSRWLTKAIEQGFLKIDSVGYRWIHDNVQEAAFSIGAEADLQKMRYQIGSIMLRRLSRQELDNSLFVVVNLLNVGIHKSMSPESALSLAKLNLRAAKRSMRLSGFEVAARYADIGIDFLPSNTWESHYDLTIQLHTLAINAHGVLGHIDLMQAMYDDVLGRPNVTLEDRLPLYYSMLESLSGRDILAAKELCHSVLEKLDHQLLRDARKISWYKRVNVITTYNRNLDPEEVSQLPTMQDPNALAAMKILSNMLVLTYVTNKAELPVVTSKMVSLVNQFGVCSEAANAYAYRGSFASNLKVVEAHAKYTECIMHRSKDRYSKAATKMYIYTLLSQIRDVRWVQKNYNENFHYSLQVGDIQMAMYSFMHVLYYSLVSGYSLQATSEETRETIRSIKLMNRGWQVGLMLILWQGVLNLQGQSDDPLVLKGEAMDETTMDPALPNTLDGALRIGFKSIIFAFCGNHHSNAQDHMDQMEAVRAQLAGNGIVFWFDAYVALSCLHCARSKDQKGWKKYRKHGQQASKRVKKWIAEGCQNLIQLDLLLDAELAVLSGDSSKAITLYQKSIHVAEQMGRVNDAGLASERLGEYYLMQQQQQPQKQQSRSKNSSSSSTLKDRARDALSRAMEFYSLWGSEYKVDSLRSKYGEVLLPSNVIPDPAE